MQFWDNIQPKTAAILTDFKEDLAQFHIEYALCYEKLKDIEKCNYHCEEAVKLYHFGMYAYERLIKNYVKTNLP